MSAAKDETSFLELGARVGMWWLCGLAFFLIVGFVLSRATLAASQRVPREPGGHAQGLDAVLRRVYRAVLWCCCAYYYVSIPIVLGGVVALGGGLIYAFFAIGTIPIKLVLIIAVGVFVTVAAVLKSLFVQRSNADPGTPVDLDENPKLRAVLSEVAERVGTRMVDRVYMTPGTDIAVMERGSMLAQLRGKSERCLILGAGVLKGMEVLSFKSVLAHEYGHFQNEDTAGGGFAIAVRRSIFVMMLHLVLGGAAAWYNPAWWFVQGFQRLFLVISQGASRLQEVLADRWAAFSYGSEAFEKGMTHVIRRSIRFDAHADASLKEIIQNQRALVNLYAYKPDDGPRAETIDEAFEDAMSREPSAYDSHPAPSDRIAWVRALAVPPPAPCEADQALVWTLFADRKKVERQMTDVVRAQIRERHGIVIPCKQAAADDQEAA
ncbi:Zn-dependent protease with chaperone function [Minicystis rosea]|nr:Zn-dependent protease with chaperone function [Minicystis rosea]